MTKDKFSPNKIPDYDANWGIDETDVDKRPYSGNAVLEFIKKELQKKPNLSDSSLSDKIKEVMFTGNDSNKHTLITRLSNNGTTLLATVINENGSEEVIELDLSLDDPNARRILVNVSAENLSMNVGGNNSVSYGFKIKQGDTTLVGQGADVTMKMSFVGNTTPFYVTTISGKSSTDDATDIIEKIDITEILKKVVKENSKILVVFEVSHSYEKEGNYETITGVASTIIQTVALKLNTGIKIDNTGFQGQFNIDYSVSGNGKKSVLLYRNGELYQSITDIETFSNKGSFVINDPLTELTNFLLIANTIVGTNTISSEVYYFDLFKSSQQPVICFKVIDPSGDVLTGDNYKNPIFKASRFSNFSFNYYVYNLNSNTVKSIITTKEFSDTEEISSSSSEQILEKKLYEYSKRIKTNNRVDVIFNVGSITRTLSIQPKDSAINLDIPTEGLTLNLDADGRSNSESNPATWNYKDVITTFNGVNFLDDGWIQESDGAALLLKNGASANINFKPFNYLKNGNQITTLGCTFEILFKCKNPNISDEPIISCLWDVNGNKAGLNITPNYVGVNTGEIQRYETDEKDENNNPIYTEDVIRVGANYVPDKYYKYTFVMMPNVEGTENGLCYGYLNGILTYIAPMPINFVNTKQTINIDSTNALVYIKSIKYYEGVSFTKDQCVDSFIADQSTIEEINNLYSDNNILINNQISPVELVRQGKGVLIITGKKDGKNIIDVLNKSDDKRTYFGPVRLDYFAPKYCLDIQQNKNKLKELGKDYNFYHAGCNIRIQGTTSTKRPRKNWRLHLDKTGTNGTGKGKPEANTFYVGGVPMNKEGVNEANCKYSMTPGAVKVPLICLKADYVDSSMTHNTGGAIVFNEITKNLEKLRNPAQVREFENGGNDVNKIKTRVSIDGFPIDVFTADSLKEGIEIGYQETPNDNIYENLKYIGQYNFNNDKSKSGAVFGFDGSYKYNLVEDSNNPGSQIAEYSANGAYEPICIEFLDNYTELDLFKIRFDDSGNIDEEETYGGYSTSDDEGNPTTKYKFSDAFEVRAPADITDAIVKDGLNASLPGYEYVPDQIKRVFNFIGNCAKSIVNDKNKTKVPDLTVQSLTSLTADKLDLLDWSSNIFLNEAHNYFNLDSACAWYIWTDYMLAVDQRAKNMMMYTMDGKHWMFEYYDGDTVLGERNDCQLAYDYTTDNDTYDNSVKQYAFQGHTSWLWYLIRANFSLKLSSTAREMRSSKFNPEYIKYIFNDLLAENWSERAYNYSQEYKYITPLSEEFPSNISNNYTNTAQGSRQSHRDYIIDNRFDFLDSQYGTQAWESNSFTFVSSESAINKLEIKSRIPYYFGWMLAGQVGVIKLREKAYSQNNYTVNLTISGNGSNNSASILGASNITELTFKEGEWICSNQGNNIKLPNLEKLTAEGITSTGTPNFTGCYKLKELNLKGTGFSNILGLNTCYNLTHLNLLDTNIDDIRLLNNQSLQELKLNSPRTLIFPTSNNLLYKSNLGEDTLIIKSLNNLQNLSIHNIDNKLNSFHFMEALNNSPGEKSSKHLRITNFNYTCTNLSSLDKYKGFGGIDSDGKFIDRVKLEGEVHLMNYEDYEKIKEYTDYFGEGLKIYNVPYTMIETDEMVADEWVAAVDEVTLKRIPSGSTTNLDNDTGYKPRNNSSNISTVYLPSGHIKNILNNCHRYLGKLIKRGTNVHSLRAEERNKYLLIRHRNDNLFLGGILDDGTMAICQLNDDDSYLYLDGSNANLSGLLQSDGIFEGEVYTKIPRFWYKGINYNPIVDRVIENGVPKYIRLNENNKKSLRYTCYSTEKEAPLKSSKIKEIVKDDWILVRRKNTLTTKIDSETVIGRFYSDNKYDVYTDIYKVNVKGYKKIRFPGINDQNLCFLFTGNDENTIIKDPVSNSYVNYGEIIIDNKEWLHTGMPAIITIPPNAEWFYFPVTKYIYIELNNNKITKAALSNPCSIILHTGEGFESGFDMTEYNAKEWIGDMEPDWVESEEMLIACGNAAYKNSSMYTSFNNTSSPIMLNSFLLYAEYARNRYLQLIDYEATKIVANLFIAKYGRRSSYNLLGRGDDNYYKYQGLTSYKGMQDTFSKSPNSLNCYKLDDNNKPFYCTCPVFLGIENIHGGCGGMIHRSYFRNDNKEEVGLLVLTDWKKERLVFCAGPNNYGGFVKSFVHGKYCDILSSRSNYGNSNSYYCDKSYVNHNINNNFIDIMIIKRKSRGTSPGDGIFHMGQIELQVGTYNGVRFMFRGNIEEYKNVEEFKNLKSVSIPCVNT